MAQAGPESIQPLLQTAPNEELNSLGFHLRSAEILPDNMISLFISFYYHNIIVQI